MTEPKVIKARPKPKQRKLAKALIANEISDKPVAIGQILKDTDYGLDQQRNPGRVIEQDGVQEALVEEAETMLAALKSQGVDPDLVANKIYELLNAEVKIKVVERKKQTRYITRVDTFAISKGIENAMKIGLGGGYKTAGTPAERPINFQLVNIPEVKILIQNMSVEIKKKIMEQFAPKEKKK